MPKRVRLAPPPQANIGDNFPSWKSWFTEFRDRVGEGPFLIQGYGVADLPDATQAGSSLSSDPFTSLIFIYNEVSGPSLAFSDGTNWKQAHSPSTTVS